MVLATLMSLEVLAILSMLLRMEKLVMLGKMVIQVMLVK